MATQGLRSNDERAERRRTWLLITIAVSGWAGYMLLALSDQPAIHRLFELPDPNNPSYLALRGQLGDSFGVFNALVSTLGLIGVLTTLRLQRAQLHAQDLQFSRIQYNEELRHSIATYSALLNEVMTTTEQKETSPRDPDSEGSEASGRAKRTLTGRAALLEIWQHEVVARVDIRRAMQLKSAQRMQCEIADGEAAPSRASRDELRVAIEGAVKEIQKCERSREQVASAIVDTWHAVHHKHKHQIDPLRAAAVAVLEQIAVAERFGFSSEDRSRILRGFRLRMSAPELYILLIDDFDLLLMSDREREQLGRTRAEEYTQLKFFDTIDSKHDVVCAASLEERKARQAKP